MTPKIKDPPPPVIPAEPAQAKAPDEGAVRNSTGRRTQDQLRSASQTILTSGSGVLTPGATDKKTVLGQ